MKIFNDIKVIKERDPAARSSLEIYLTYPGLHAIRSHRKAHFFYQHNMKLLARLISAASKFFTGIEIHPGAIIGDGLFIDHGSGVVIGETAIIGKNVTLYQGVTLGGTGKDTGKRHPTIEDDVMISAGAKVLGPFTVGKGSKIGAGSVVLKEVPPYSTVVGIPGKVVKSGTEEFDSRTKTMNQIKMPDPVVEALDCLTTRIKELEKEILKLEFDSYGIKVGNTPSRLLENSNGYLAIKEEYYNPTGSVKDRTALNIIKQAYINKQIDSSTTVLEATSGNTGISLAYITQKLGLKCIIFMPENMSKERIALIESYNARVVLTDAALGIKGAVDKLNETKKEISKYYVADQFNNKYNAPAHYETAREILQAFPDLDYIVSGIGTGGTVTGIKTYINGHGIKTKVIGIEPLSSPLLTEGRTGRHKIQGIGANFVPKVLKADIIDKIVDVADDDALNSVSELYKKFNVKAGISTGANFYVANKLYNEGYKVLFIAHDGGGRYESMNLYK